MRAMMMKKRSTRILMPTITALNSADSLMPQTSTIVIKATIPRASRLNTIGNAEEVRRALDQSRDFLRRAKIGRQPLRNRDPERVVDEGAKIVGPADRDRDVADGVFEDQVPADDPCDQLPQGGVGVGVGRPGDRHHRGHLGIAERREGADDGRDRKREHQRGAGARAGGVAGGGGADRRENAGADDRADADQGHIERPENPLERPLFVAQRREKLVQVLGAEEPSKQRLPPSPWIVTLGPRAPKRNEAEFGMKCRAR